MDSGSNKSLYTIIAVVVFGIFLSLSYYLFQDQLKGVLASVMDGTSEMTSTKLDNNGLIPTDSKHFQIVDNGDGTCTIVGYDKLSGTDIVIPAKINNLTVTTIGDSAFMNTGITSVVFPYTLIKIEGDENSPSKGAFRNCNLSEVYLPDSITYVGRDAFYNCKINVLYLSNSLEFIGIGAFNMNKYKELIIPNSVKTISTLAFSGNIYLTTLTIPVNVTKVGSMIILGDSALHYLYVPNTLKSYIYVDSEPLITSGGLYFPISKVIYY